MPLLAMFGRCIIASNKPLYSFASTDFLHDEDFGALAFRQLFTQSLALKPKSEGHVPRTFSLELIGGLRTFNEKKYPESWS